MHSFTISVKSSDCRQAVEDRLRELAASGPFRILDLATVGVGVWAFHLQPMRPGLAIGFGKVAEFLVLLAREFEVQTVERQPTRAVAAAS